MQKLALVPVGVQVDPNVLSLVAIALQMQIMVDFAPHWNTTAVVSHYTHLDLVPADCWIILLAKDAKGRAGLHMREGSPVKGREKDPYAIVQYLEGTLNWSIAASHEALEMLVDFLGTYTVPAINPKDGKAAGYLVEICDPCQHQVNAYPIDGVKVSDFCLPAYYGLGQGGSNSFKGNVAAPLDLAPRGLVTFKRGKEWFQWDATHGAPVMLGPVSESLIFGSRKSANYRGTLDRHRKDYSGPVVSRHRKAAAAAHQGVKISAAMDRRNQALRKFLDAMGIQLP